MAKERLRWVDLAKVISICLVTSYHTPPPLTGYAAQLVQLLRMPAFFLIAGFLFDDRKFASLGTLLKHRARQLLVPYAAYELLLIPLTSRSMSELKEGAMNALLGHPTVCYPLWFLVCLFGMQVVHYVGIRLTDKLTHGGFEAHGRHLLLVYVGLCTVLSPLSLTNHLQLNAIVINLPFYAAANCCKRWISETSWRHYKLTAACLVGGLLLVAVKWRWMEHMEESMGRGMLYYVMHLSAGWMLLPPYIACCKLLSKMTGKLTKWIAYMGSNTMVILALHTYMILALTKGLEVLTGSGWLLTHGWMNPLLTVAVVAMHWPIIRLINAWTPWLSGKGHRTAAQ